jgi:sugar lactone lactonase YvrE
MEAKVNKARRAVRIGLILGAVGTAIIASAACADETSDNTGKAAIDKVANDPNIETPVDATPSPDGKDVYFIASSKLPDEDNIGVIQTAAIYKVSAAGGAITKLFQGEPLVAPFNISISNDGQTLYIADVGAVTSEDRADGRVYSMGVGGGSPSPLSGTDGLAPGGLDVMGDSLYITGRKDGKAGVFKTGFAGGAVTPVAVGEAFSDPSGVAVARSGEIYVVDTGSATHSAAMASVVKVTPDGKTTVVMDGLSVGHPAGIALSNDEKTIFVSGFDSGKGTDVVFTIDAASRTVGRITDGIGEFNESAGLHRARNADVMAWADSRANGTGTVYVLRGSGQ